MRIQYVFLGAFLAIAQTAYAEVAPPPVLAPLKQQAQAAELSAQFLSRFGYKPVPLDDAMSARIMDRFIKSLDPDHVLFLQVDIDKFMSDRNKIDDAVERRDLKIPYAIFNVYEQRVVDRMSYARKLLKEDFDFSTQETYSERRDQEPWPQSEAESNELWRKRVKADWLRLKLGGKSDTAIRETLDKRYANAVGTAYKYKTDDVFQSFMDAYTTSIDPHTDYFGAAASAEFNISMNLSLFGIGAVLQERDDYATIRELVAGGPAQASGKLTVGDRIAGVGQGKDGPMKEVVGTRLDEVVQMIRGKKGSIVRLEILPADAGADAPHRIISLVRDKVSLEKQAAKKNVLSVKVGEATRKIGVITLPAFYEDFGARRKGDKEYRSASRDVARLLGELKDEKVDGVLIDVRNNGGGSLDEAVDVTGLFIGKGPVVQQRGSDGRVDVRRSDFRAPVWSGPMGVLINRGSASASEIFAAAIQDYGRGVIIGEQSFGKGTVQTVVDLDQMVRNSRPEYGELKVTVAQFFRVNGGTTQLRGVTPDISLPGYSDPTTFGETSYDNALPWAEIKPAKYSSDDALGKLLPTLKDRHDVRVKSDQDFQHLSEDIADLKAQRERGVISLNEAERRKDASARDSRLKSRALAGDEDVSGGDEDLAADERSLSDDIALENARKKAKDVLLSEAAAILADQADLQKAR